MVAPPWSRRRILLALVTAVVIGGAGGSAGALAKPVTYTATSQVFVSAQPMSLGALNAQSTLMPSVVGAWVEVVTTPLVLEPVIAELHLHASVAAVAKQVHAFRPANTALVQIEATDPTAAGAARLANAVQDRLVAVAPSLMPRTGASQPTDKLTSILPATPPAAPSGPSPAVLALAGALAGVLVWALILAVVQIRRRPPGVPGQPAPSML